MFGPRVPGTRGLAGRQFQRPPSARPPGSKARSSFLFDKSPKQRMGISSPQRAKAQGLLWRGPATPGRAYDRKAGEGGGCEGRGGTGRPLWRRGRGSSLLGGIRLISLGLRLTTSLPPLKTPRLRSWRRVPSAGGSQPPRRGPNLSSSIRGSERTRLRTGSAGGGPAPLRPGVGAAPPPSAAAMLIPGERGGDGLAPRLSAPLPWPLPALVTPEESPLR